MALKRVENWVFKQHSCFDEMYNSSKLNVSCRRTMVHLNDFISALPLLDILLTFENFLNYCLNLQGKLLSQRKILLLSRKTAGKNREACRDLHFARNPLIARTTSECKKLQRAWLCINSVISVRFSFFFKKSFRFQGNHVFDSHSLKCSRGGKIEMKSGFE